MARRQGKLGAGEFAKYHALGNDYLVVDAARFGGRLTPQRVRALCDRNRGPGSDGILAVRRASGRGADFGVRIFNPDGSEAETSGNGLRIAARFLHDFGYARRTSFTLETRGGRAAARLLLRRSRVERVAVDMGTASFLSSRIPVTGPEREVVDERIVVDSIPLHVCCVSVGNPHCVVFVPEVRREDLLRFGPRLEHHPSFPERINVQLARVHSPTALEALIWERGAGETLASGSSSCAVAAAAFKKGLTEDRVRVRLPGGELDVEINDDFQLRLTGPCTPVYRGRLLEAAGGGTA